MTKRRSLELAVFLLALLLPAACDQVFRTGRVGNTTNAPNADGACPAGLSVCGKGAFAQCLDLQNDRMHCGTCDNACALGIACAMGACQQVACVGPVAVSTQTLPETTAPTGATLSGALLADVNGDGRPDLVTCHRSQTPEETFQVALGQASGGFGLSSTYQAANAVGFILAADSNGDGFDDLYVNDAWQSSCLEIWLGHADGKLTPTTGAGNAGCIVTLAQADLNGDGVEDTVAYTPYDVVPAVFLADANGALHVGTRLSAKHNGTVVMVQDWNGDGLPDLVGVSQILAVYLNRGNGTFEDEIDCGVFISNYQQVVIADFNRDGHPDVAAAMIAEGVGVLLGMGGCEFQPMAEYPLSGSVVGLAYTDLDGDGLGDLVARTSDGVVSALHGEVDGTFQVTPLASVGACLDGCSLLVADVTGDGKVDIVVAGGSEMVLESGKPPTEVVYPTQVLANACP